MRKQSFFSYALTNLHLMPGGGTATGLPTPLAAIAIAANFLFGILLNFGIGNYAPTLIMLSLMGMDPRLRRASHWVEFPAVLVAAFIVKSMSVELLRWLVVRVVLSQSLPACLERRRRQGAGFTESA